MYGEFLDLLTACPEEVSKSTGLRMQEHESLSRLHGGHTWPVALRMAKALSVMPWSALMSGKRILELGSGTGVVGMLAAGSAGPLATVLLTDGDPGVAEALAGAILANQLSGQCTSAAYEWGGDARVLGTAAYDVILAADCLYSLKAVGELCNALDQLVSPGITRVLCACEERWGTTEGLELLRGRHWECVERGVGFPETLCCGETGSPPREGTFHMFELCRPSDYAVEGCAGGAPVGGLVDAH